LPDAEGEFRYAEAVFRYVEGQFRYARTEFRYGGAEFRYAAAWFRYAPAEFRYAGEEFRYARGQFCYAREEFRYVQGRFQRAIGEWNSNGERRAETRLRLPGTKAQDAWAGGVVVVPYGVGRRTTGSVGASVLVHLVSVLLTDPAGWRWPLVTGDVAARHS
jgi:hypothetical protein